jgi:hypothetical protein
MKKIITAYGFLMVALFSPPALPQTPTPAGSGGVNSSLLTEMKFLKDEITLLNAQRSDTRLQYNHALRTHLEGLMRAQAEADQKAGNAQAADELLKGIANWEALRRSEWDQDQVLLEKKSQLRQLLLDQLMETNRSISDQLLEKGDLKRMEELKEGRDFIQQMKDLEKQTL